MWRNYLTVGVRSLLKNRVYAAINILGLAIGMAACLMILLFVRYEFSYDQWLPNSDNVYQFQSWYKSKETGEDNKLQMTPWPAGKAAAKDFPQIEKEVYAFTTEPVMIEKGVAITIKDFIYTDGNLLEVIQLPLLSGNRADLNAPGTAAVSRSQAIARFGTDNVVGRTLTVISRGKSRDFRIVAVFQDIPKNSHIEANAIARIDYVAWNADTPDALDCWGCQNGFVYLKLRPGTDPKSIEAQLPAWEKRNIPIQRTGEATFDAGEEQDWHLVKVKDIHLGEGQDGAMRPGNDKGTITTFAVIALLILGMAVVNFTNLATARASQRAREVALRKVLGADRRQLIIQFIGESVLVAFLAMLIALALAELLTPAFSAFLDANIRLRYFGADGIILPVIGLVLVVGILGGLYPAFFLSRFQPASVLKANKSSAETPGTGRLRQALVVCQFAVSIGLIICTGVVYAQTVYARTVDPGYKRDHILQVDELSRYQLIGRGQQIADAAKRVPGVQAVGRTGIGVATTNNSNTGVMVPGRKDPVTIGIYSVDQGLKDAIGMTLIAGRWYRTDAPMDEVNAPYPPDKVAEAQLTARGGNIVINELAAKRLGYNDPKAIIGKTFRVAMFSEEAGLMPVTIIGVVKDARFRSIREPLDPMMFVNSSTGGHTHMIVRFNGDPVAVRRGVEKAWQSAAPDVPFDGRFSEDVVEELYNAEEARAQIFAAFAVLAVIVGCLGLFGLAAFTADRRTKEIGIRKVLGARTRDIVRLLVWQFTRPVIVANLIAWPVAWWLMRDWLNKFDDRIALGPTPFLAAGALALLIAVGTIAGHAMKVASANPIRALRYE
ncbi:FtsX-like permease family protein [Sphingomonas sp. ID1715]|uniref:ABC transporter permease n=1 Tax=Sphingomonas sp. ID1715 TaxID=1656898 RepID=UPI001487E3C1|nr:ABC transporter permease [Sphingomonas sp. ID1715]NNM75508.1 FtsX-like permease family protein [Sphingomonas sp. ID1715]